MTVNNISGTKINAMNTNSFEDMKNNHIFQISALAIAHESKAEEASKAIALLQEKKAYHVAQAAMLEELVSNHGLRHHDVWQLAQYDRRLMDRFMEAIEGAESADAEVPF